MGKVALTGKKMTSCQDEIDANRIIPLDSLLNQHYFKCHGSFWKKKNSAYSVKFWGNREKKGQENCDLVCKILT